MRIQILSDESWYGGASIANNMIKDELEKRGHKVVLHTINQTIDTWKGDMSADYYIVANWAYIDRKLLEKLFYEKKIMKFYHDIPGYMYESKSVKYEQQYKFLEFMANNADINVFISPLQLDVYRRYINIKEENSMIIPPPKKLDGFKNVNKWEDRIHDVLYLGDISHARGIIDAINICKENKLDIRFIGPFVDKKLVKELKEHGYHIEEEIPNNKVAGIMNNYKYLIYMPNLIDSFCFKVVEAELCGCKLIVDNYRIGRFYYNNTAKELKQTIEQTASVLVDKIENGKSTE